MVLAALDKALLRVERLQEVRAVGREDRHEVVVLLAQTLDAFLGGEVSGHSRRA